MRIGIIGTGRIARRFMPEAVAVGAEVVCAFNPHRESVQRFVDEIRSYAHDLEAFSSIDDLWNVVDAVYIATPHETHYRYIIDALSHGKHVLCEKPMTLVRGQSQECFDLASEKKLVLLEGIKTAFCPGFEKLVSEAKSGLIGDIRYIEACFTKLEDSNNRELTDQKYGGSFRELGSYILLPVFALLGYHYKDISFDSIYGNNGIDIFTKADIRYKDAMATVTCGLGVKSEGRLIVAGTKGYITVEPPWWKTAHFEAHFEDASKVIRYDEPFECDGLRYEIRWFHEMARKTMENGDVSAAMHRANAHEAKADARDYAIDYAKNQVIEQSRDQPKEMSIAMAEAMEIFGRKQ